MGAAERGWGPGWPNCQSSKMTRVAAGGVTVNVRREIARLVEHALRRTRETGYVLKQDQTGAYVCRPIGGTTRPSNHSWGLAIDINWRENPFTYNANAPRTITPAVVAIWKSVGFSWGGDWSGKKDFMHFEFLGTPADAARRTANLTVPQPAPQPARARPKEDPVQLITSEIIQPGEVAPFAVAPVRVAAYGPAHVSVCADFVPAGQTVRLAVADGDGKHQVIEALPLKSGRTYGFEIAAGGSKAGSIHNRSTVPVVVLVEHFLA